jgi:type IV pilus assembly protein PilA
MQEASAGRRSRIGTFLGWAFSFVAWTLIVFVVILGGLLLFLQHALGALTFVALVIGLGFVLRRKWPGEVIGIALAVVVLAALSLNSAHIGGTMRFAHETAAIKAIQTIHTMQAQYKTQYGHFATSLAELGPPASGAPTATAADLISRNLASGEMSGYKFTITGQQDGYAIHANPVKFGPTGTRTFYSDQTLLVYENYDPEPATATSKALK